ncbi:ATP-binding cassette domain-containing protein [Desulfoferrobacter suflitae]|uniref:ATP-binding cassette domain-containing protein n=1 Tax=Desulfoferrobacter suflitae TaxID=2865782 RepID=UPI002164D969|nr:ATP-binding cassette domain-containing protein [Desulfoferrobacter suflitae]MCK8604324.1 ATP-binding cassette domain-containing protein [Desulfoferrobacter suflitae]
MIEYANVTKVFGSGPNVVTAVNDVTFKIEKGHVVAFLGPSGCGKTTLLRLTNRLIPLTRGKITVNGRDILSEDAVKLRQSMGYAIQAIGLFPNKTIYENIATVPRLLGWKEDKIRERADELLTMLRLEPGIFRDRYPAELSGGQQQRVGVARSLAADPEIVLMDEPFGAIDPINREEIQNEFLRIQNELKKTIAFVTHDIHEAIKVGDEIAIFQGGKLIQYDTPEAILTRPKNKYIADFVGADRALKVLGLLRTKDAMNTNPRNIVKGSCDAQEVLKFLEEKGLKHAIVVENNKPLGYVTPKLVKHENGPVRNAVDTYPRFIQRYDTLRDVMSTMLMQDMQTLCVVDDNGDFIGTISLKNIQSSILDAYTDEEDS